MTNSLNLNEYGVAELNQREMVETEGGIVPLLIAGLVVIATSCVATREVGTSTEKMIEADSTHTKDSTNVEKK